MKLHSNELTFGKTHTQHKVLAIVFTLVTVTVILLLYKINLVNYYSLFLLKSSPMPPSSSSTAIKPLESQDNCDIFSGEWVPNPNGPYYTNSTCWAIHEHQNCLKYGRPDSGFMQWRWKPDGCELPIFNPSHFIELMRDKSLAFVGDSLSRNHVQSLICLLSQVKYLKNISASYTVDNNFRSLQYKDYNFTIVHFWSPYLIKANLSDLSGSSDLYLDEYDQDWTTQIADFDYLIISTGHWFFRPIVYYENKQLVGHHSYHIKNMTDLGLSYGYRKALRTAFKAINSLKTAKSFKGMTILRTFSPQHYENGQWNDGGDCVRTRPFMRNETQLEGQTLELYKIQMEEFRAAEEEGRKKGLKYRLLDTTKAMVLRPDGHPSRYGRWPDEKVRLHNDCVHWCLPGPIDSLNDFLLEMLKRD